MKRKDIFFVGAFMVSFMLCAVVMTGDYFYQYLERGYRWHREEQTEHWHEENEKVEHFGNTEEVKENLWISSEPEAGNLSQGDEDQGTIESNGNGKGDAPSQSDHTGKEQNNVLGEEAGNTGNGQEEAPGHFESADGKEDVQNPSTDQNEETTDNRIFTETLFIGDSRTVGLMEYGGIENADFFADSGMSVFSLQMKEIAVGDLGKVSLEELLAEKRYGKIYIMLGINELGYRFDAIQNKYKECLALIQNSQREAVVYLCANMHVTKAQSVKDLIYNNENVNKVNAMIASLAESGELQYLDVNELFDDKAGNLSDVYSVDAFHVLGKYYTDWAAWIKEKEV